MNIGFFGGTFNPVHKGHTSALKRVMEQVNFDKVIILPAKIPPHKVAHDLAAEQDRFNMCRFAFDKFSNIEISDFEMKNEGKSYSVITLRHFRMIYPEDKLFFIMGSDMLLSFEKWYCYEEILKLASLVCVSRADEDTDKLLPYAKKLESEGGEIIIVPVEPFEISSTEIRERLKKKLDCSCYLDKNVVQYIVDKNLYNEVL